MKQDMMRKYLPYGLILIVLLVSYFIIKPYLTIFLISCVLAYTFYPLYKLTKKILKNEIISSLFVSFLTILILFLLIGFILLGIYSESLSSYNNIREKLYGEEGYLNCDAEENFCEELENISSYLTDENINKYIDIESSGNVISNYIMSHIKSFFTSIPKFLLNFTIIIFIMYY
ncbi:MAG: AI-2E family transporter, partial [Candidatus Woesearchaeota archaeon]